MIEAQFLLGTLEAFLDGPAQPGGAGQFSKLGADRCKHQIVGACFRIRFGCNQTARSTGRTLLS